MTDRRRLKRPRPKPSESQLEAHLVGLLRLRRLPAPEREHRFAPPRRWRFDLAWPDRMLAVEVEGGLWIAGRHNRPAGMLADMEKYNAAALAGWRVLRFAREHILSGEAIETIRQGLKVAA